MLNSAGKLFLFYIFSPSFLFSKNDDSLKISKQNSITYYFNESQFEFNDSLNILDNSLFNFQNYFEKNNLGNSGLPFNSFNFTVLPTKIGFNYSKNNYQNYFYHPNSLQFYTTRTPFSDLFYVIGSKVEQIFKMTFSYNVKKNWNVTANFNRIRSEGTYLRQQTYDNFISVSSNYKAKNNRYFFLLSINYNNIKNNENGGITADSIFENSRVVDRKLISTNLISAKRGTINRSVFFKQYINFGKKSTDTTIHNKIIPGCRLILTSRYDDNILKYEDDTPLFGYYSHIYYDSTKTFDSTYNSNFENELKWKRVDNTKQRGLKDMLGVTFGVKDQFVKIHQREIDTSFNNIIAIVEFYNTYSKNMFLWNISGKYGMKGSVAKDYEAIAEFKKCSKDTLNVLILKAETKQQNADFIFIRYSSNNFKWNNNFEKMIKKSASVNFSMKRYSLVVGADFSEYTNVLYFDNYAIAKQYAGSIPVISAFLKKDFEFHNFHLNNKINYQYVPDSTVIRLPEFVLEHSLYFENDVLKDGIAIMRIQIGASVFYNSAYYSNAYMPATGEFYLQNQKKYGNYPFIDFFVNAKIKTVRLFFKIDHLNSGLMGNNYILTPNYPMNDRAFKFGISWRFFD